MRKFNKKWIALLIVIGLHQSAVAQDIKTAVPLGTSQRFHDQLASSTKSSNARVVTEVDLTISTTKSLKGKINFKESKGNQELLVGEISGVKDASFFIKASDRSLEGHIILKDTKKAYKYYSDASGNAFVEEVNINTLICIDYENKPTKKQQKEAEAQSKQAAVISPALLDLQSTPGAAGCILLDFDGYYMPAGNYWNNGNPINAAPSGMSDDAVREHWEIVAEDFRPFNVNITTNESVFNSYPRNRRRRCVVTPTNTAAPGAGGVAYIGSFNWDNDVPCWEFMTSGKAGGEASSHEIGHCFDLQHDGRSNPDEGYFGGIDGTAWAPIMGVGYYRPVSQWSKGEYNYAKNDQPGVLQDDVATIAGSKFGVGYRGDDYSDGTAGAANLDYNGSGAINQKYGIIANEADYDFFTFTTGGGNVVINASTVGRHGNLHLLIRLYNSAGGLIGTYWNGDPFALNATMNVNLAAGKYFVGIDGNGAGDPKYGGYSAYGSIGSYWVTGTIPPANNVNATTGLVTTYKDVNYTGFSGGFSIGDYNLAALTALGVEDNSITSLRVAQGYKAILYFDDNFTGQSIEITADNGFVGIFNDQVTSMRVRANGVQNVAGTYFLQNRNSNLNMDVWGASTSDGANIAQGNPNGGVNQKFTLTHLGDGLYKVIANVSGKSLDINSFSKANGANVEQYNYNATDNQQFIAVATDLAGCYKLIARHSGKVVEVAAASTANGANVQQWDNNNQTCGQWKFVVPINPSTGFVTAYADCYYGGFTGGLNIGDYNLAALKALGINDDAISSLKITQGYQAILYQDDNFTGGSSVINSDNTCLNTTWNDKVTSIRVIANGVTNVAGNYFLQNLNSGLNMDVFGISTADGANIAQGTPNNGTNQQFKFTHLGDGVYQILAVHSGKSIDIDAIKMNDGANVQQWTYFGSANQQFIVFPTDLTGTYKLIAKHSGKVVEVAGASTANNANVQQWTNNNQTCGQWKFVPVVITPPVDGTGDGLIGNYFNGMNFETAVYNRKDATINFDWGGGSPNAAVNADRFSVRWSGQVQPKYSGEYTFFVNSDNGRRLWINGQLVIDSWIDDWNVDYSGKIILTANQKYDIRLEYFENYGGAGAKLEWSHASQTRQVIPTKQLYSGAVAPVNQPPSVSLTSPANNVTSTAPASFTIAANANDADGAISKVEFYNGTTLLNSDATAPYSFAWTNVIAGTYTITAKAYDNNNVSVTSSAVTMKVNPVVVTDQCSGLPTYTENGAYVAGSKVKSAGRQYECKEYPYSGWCNGAAWAYAPGTGAYWTDAWYDRGTCSARMANDANASSLESVTISPNPAFDVINIHLNKDAVVSVFNCQGQEVIPAKACTSEEVTIDVSGLTAGIYVIKIASGSTINTHVLVKQ